MLEKTYCGTSGDLWALGCVVYLLFVGKTPFVSNNEYLTFNKIKEGKFVFPENINSDAKDLISNLLVLDEFKRLGSGKKGENNDLNALKNH